MESNRTDEGRGPRVVAWGIFAVSLALSAAGVVLLVLTRDVPVGEVYAGAELHRAIGEASRPTSRPLSVRAALHTGLAELRGRDYFGPAVNRCARLRGIAIGGQTLVSAATRELHRDQVPDGLALVDLGDRELKDLGPERVYELREARALR